MIVRFGNLCFDELYLAIYPMRNSEMKLIWVIILT